MLGRCITLVSDILDEQVNSGGDRGNEDGRNPPEKLDKHQRCRSVVISVSRASASASETGRPITQWCRTNAAHVPTTLIAIRLPMSSRFFNRGRNVTAGTPTKRTTTKTSLTIGMNVV